MERETESVEYIRDLSFHGDKDSTRGPCYVHIPGAENEGSNFLRSVGILLHHQTASTPEDGGSTILRSVGILPLHYTVPFPEDGGSTVLRNDGTL